MTERPAIPSLVGTPGSATASVRGLPAGQLGLNGKPYALQPEYSNRGHIYASASVEDE